VPVRTCVVSFKDSTSISASVVEVIKFGVCDKHMTAEERTIAKAALHAGPWASHDQIVIAVADRLALEPPDVEAVLMRLRISEVLNCVHYVKDSVCYEEGKNWADRE
jgi:hypothetical protein